MDIASLTVAFVFGWIARQFRLPPMVGFLLAGFALQPLGVQAGAFLQELSDIGIMLLLFSIGLKLNVRTLGRNIVWLGTSVQMLLGIALFSLLLFGIGLAGVSLLVDLDITTLLLIAFALSFSSTVFAVKVLEERGGAQSMHGRIAIAMLVVQDIFAVIFLTFSKGEYPSLWAFTLLAIPALRPLLIWLMARSGHGELLILFGFFVAVIGSYYFGWVGLKQDLGALVFGMLLSGTGKSDELSKSLLGFKDIFLVAFFLSIGLSGVPTLSVLFTGLLIAFFVPVKSFIYFFVLTRFRLRARTSFLATLMLSTYSEFGLIVSTVAADYGWMSNEWLLVFAIAVSVSFVVSSPLNTFLFYNDFDRYLQPFELPRRLPDDEPIKTGDAEILIFGMGRVGAGAYQYMTERYGHKVMGLDEDWQVVENHQKAGRNVILGDASDSDFWERLRTEKVRIVMLTMTNHAAVRFSVTRLRHCSFYGKIAAVALYEDDIAELQELGVDSVFHIYAEAGTGFAEHVCERMLSA